MVNLKELLVNKLEVSKSVMLQFLDLPTPFTLVKQVVVNWILPTTLSKTHSTLPNMLLMKLPAILMLPELKINLSVLMLLNLPLLLKVSKLLTVLKPTKLDIPTPPLLILLLNLTHAEENIIKFKLLMEKFPTNFPLVNKTVMPLETKLLASTLLLLIFPTNFTLAKHNVLTPRTLS